MGKPKKFMHAINAYGERITVPRFINASQLHNAMDQYAKSLEPEEVDCLVRVEFPDDSFLEITVERELRQITYTDYDGEKWASSYYSGKRWAIGEHRSTSPTAVVRKAYALPKNAKVTVIKDKS